MQTPPKIKCYYCNELFQPQNLNNTVFCSHKCRSDTSNWKNRRKKGMKSMTELRIIQRSISACAYRRYKGTECEICGFIPIHKCQLDVDHIDGNKKNNEDSNFQTLCANCHRLKTYLSKEGMYTYNKIEIPKTIYEAIASDKILNNTKLNKYKYENLS